ncbi:MAG: hypothetical protein KAX65_08060 [Caldilineaceae bacterium]|jgi:hypothetical protein|nr:hypothetical protein [Caldilineaceae bacterium]
MAAKKFLSKAEIFAQDDLKHEDVQVPEWGGAFVRVRSMSASERDRFEAGTVQRNGKNVTTNLEHIRARLCIMCLVDENGEHLFDDGDTFPLGAKSAAALDRIFQVAQKLNGLREEDVNELAANFPPAPNGDSPSD